MSVIVKFIGWIVLSIGLALFVLLFAETKISHMFDSVWGITISEEALWPICIAFIITGGVTLLISELMHTQKKKAESKSNRFYMPGEKREELPHHKGFGNRGSRHGERSDSSF